MTDNQQQQKQLKLQDIGHGQNIKIIFFDVKVFLSLCVCVVLNNGGGPLCIDSISNSYIMMMMEPHKQYLATKIISSTKITQVL